jgi:hypothetical protein
MSKFLRHLCTTDANTNARSNYSSADVFPNGTDTDAHTANAHSNRIAVHSSDAGADD